ncbi:MAG TPA: HD domain-containing protein [bacterium]
MSALEYSPAPEDRRAAATEILRLFVAASRNTRLYPRGHPALQQSVEEVHAAMTRVLSRWGSLRYDLVENVAFGERELLEMEMLFVAQFASAAATRGVGSLIFLRGLTSEELTAAAAVFGREPEELVTEGGLPLALKAAGVAHVVVGPPREWLVTETDITKRTAPQVYQWVAETYTDVAAAARETRAVDLLRVHFVVESLLRMTDRFPRETFALLAAGTHDDDSPYHAVNVAVLSILIARRDGASDDLARSVGLGAYLHDLGRAVPPAELPLSADFERTPFHAAAGAFLMRDFTRWDTLAVIAAVEHHDYVRAGYAAQHPVARIVTVADYYDAATHARPPVPRRLPHQAVAHLLGQRGTAFDPAVVAAFIGAIGLYPVGTALRLDSGEVGLVTAQTQDVARPILRITRDAAGAQAGGFLMDLQRHAARQIVAEVDGEVIGLRPDDVLV